MRALLDTHIWLWMLTEPDRLGTTRGLVEDPDTELLLSAASTWEIGIKYALGRLPLPGPPASYVPDRLRSSAVTTLPIGVSDTLAVAELPHHHRDPFDRLLVVQAQAHGIPIITADDQIAQYDVEVLHPDADR